MPAHTRRLRRPSFATPACGLVVALVGGLAGCELPVDEVCARYVQCQSAFDAAFNLPPTDLAAFDPGGSCWELPQAGARCIALCEVTLHELAAAARDAGEELPACR